MPSRRRLSKDLPKAHDWEKRERTSVGRFNGKESWCCTKCGAFVEHFRTPNRYARFEPFQGRRSKEAVNLVQVTLGPGMLCDEVVTWKVTET